MALSSKATMQQASRQVMPTCKQVSSQPARTVTTTKALLAAPIAIDGSTAALLGLGE